MAGLGATPSRPVGAEDIRDLRMEMTKAPQAVDPGAVDHVLVWARTGL
jgi:hypothetical protein